MRRMTARASRIVLTAATAVQVTAICHAQFEAVSSPAKPDNAFDRAVASPKQQHAARSLLDGLPYAQQREPVPDDDAATGVLQTGERDRSARRFSTTPISMWRAPP